MPTEAAPEVASAEEPVAEEATDEQAPAIDEATWKRRIAGKDQALTAAQRERDQARHEAEELRKWKAQRESADMTELERIQLERDEARKEAEAAKAEARRAVLAARYPLAVGLYAADDPLPTEETLASLQERLAAMPKDEPEPEPRIDPNNPPRRPAAPLTGVDAARARLRQELDAALGRS